MKLLVTGLASGVFLLFAVPCAPTALVQAEKTDKGIKPLLDRITLQIGDRAIKQQKTTQPWQNERVIGGLRLVLDKDKIMARKLADDKETWNAETPAGLELTWLAVESDAAYFVAFNKDKKTGRMVAESPPKVRCLNLDSGKWSADLLVANAQAKPKEKSEVAAVLPGKDTLLVMTNTSKADNTNNLTAYTVTCFQRSNAKTLWTKTFLAAAEHPSPGVFLLASATRPDSAEPDVRPLTWLDDKILVCAGYTQNLICLEPDSGKTAWELEKLWEYDRGFTGPSVWRHHMAREDGKELDKRLRCSIMGGPVIVPGNKARDARIFVAVSKGPVSPYSDYLSQGWVYEIDAEGEPIALVSLPRLVNGGQWTVHEGGVVWACHENTFVRLVARRNAEFSRGPGGSACLCDVDWYRRLNTLKPKAWLTAGAAGDPVALGKSSAFRVPAGGYIADPTESIYRFPMAMVDLATGQEQRLTLEVPFEGKIPEPTTNYSRTKTPDGKMYWSTPGPYLLAITQLRLEQDTLRITLGMDNWSAVLDFTVGKNN